MKFKIMDRVLIKEIDQKGTVISIHQQIGNCEYQVRYFMNGEPQTIYYHDFELEHVRRE